MELETVPSPVLTDLKPRLEAAAAAVADAKAAWHDAVALRNELVVAAIDAGMSYRATAAAAGVADGRIGAILACSDPDLD